MTNGKKTENTEKMEKANEKAVTVKGPAEVPAVPSFLRKTEDGPEGLKEEIPVVSMEINKSSGDAFFLLPDGTQVEHIDCIIMLCKFRKTYWKKSYDEGGGSVPTCSSDAMGADGKPIPTFWDNENETGPQAKTCAECQWDKLGTDHKGGKGKRCSDVYWHYLLMQGRTSPVLLKLSSKAHRKQIGQFYGPLKQVKPKIPYASVAVRLSLAVTKNASGVAHPQIRFRNNGQIDFEANPDVTAMLAKAFEDWWEICNAPLMAN